MSSAPRRWTVRARSSKFRDGPSPMPVDCRLAQAEYRAELFVGDLQALFAEIAGDEDFTA
ncbi:hypothetical protein [Amycolatopsis sp. NPDC051128]|uniref:hypothetical protein n=1 Tax=Amycolatopsis sp. NPDC051128 TaxID=3155412 RepID=UPI0034144597